MANDKDFKALETMNAELMAKLEKQAEENEARIAAIAQEPPNWSEQLRALEAQIKAMQAGPPVGGGGFDAATLESILSRVTSAASKNSELIASKYKPENVDHLHKGPFEHPLGGIQMPKPELPREVHFAGGRLRLDELTYAEACAVVDLSKSLSRSQRRIARDGKWICKVSDDDARMQISVPLKNIDDRNDLPPFLQICEELTTGERPLDTAELAQEVALLRRQVAAMQAAV